MLFLMKTGLIKPVKSGEDLPIPLFSGIFNAAYFSDHGPLFPLIQA